jgi:hypothetical protein
VSDELRAALPMLASMLEDPTDAHARTALADQYGHEDAATRMRQLARFAELLSSEIAAEAADDQGPHWPIYEQNYRLLRAADRALARYAEGVSIPPTERLSRLLELAGLVPVRP